MSKKMILLKSSDGVSFKIDEAVALQSQTIIKSMAEEDCVNGEIPLANVKSKILEMVIEYCKKHVDYDSSTYESKQDLKKWDAEFVTTMESSTLFAVMLAAYHLHIKSLVDLTCQTVADVLSSKTSDEIRAYLNIEKDLSPEEEEEIRREYRFE